MSALVETLTTLFGAGSLENTCYDWGPDYYLYKGDDFRVDISENQGHYWVAVDLKTCFNKVSQSPIHFCFSEDKPLSRRKMKRISAALRFLIENKKEAGSFFGELPGFDDLGSHVMRDFYHSPR